MLKKLKKWFKKPKKDKKEENNKKEQENILRVYDLVFTQYGSIVHGEMVNNFIIITGDKVVVRSSPNKITSN